MDRAIFSRQAREETPSICKDSCNVQEVWLWLWFPEILPFKTVQIALRSCHLSFAHRDLLASTPAAGGQSVGVLGWGRDLSCGKGLRFPQGSQAAPRSELVLPGEGLRPGFVAAALLPRAAQTAEAQFPRPEVKAKVWARLFCLRAGSTLSPASGVGCQSPWPSDVSTSLPPSHITLPVCLSESGPKFPIIRTPVLLNQGRTLFPSGLC